MALEKVALMRATSGKAIYFGSGKSAVPSGGEVMQMLIHTIGFSPYEVILMIGFHVEADLRPQ